MPDINFGAHCFKAFQVQVDRPGADRAAARQAHADATGTRQQRPHHQEAGPHFAHQFARWFAAHNARRIDRERAALKMRRRTEMIEHATHTIHIRKPGAFINRRNTLGEQGSRDQRQHGIFCAADMDFAKQASAAFDQYFFQTDYLALSITLHAATAASRATPSASRRDIPFIKFGISSGFPFLASTAAEGNRLRHGAAYR